MSSLRMWAGVLVLATTCSCAARFYGGDKLPPNRLIRLAGTTDLYGVKVDNSPTPAMQHWILLPGEHYVSAKFANTRAKSHSATTVIAHSPACQVA